MLFRSPDVPGNVADEVLGSAFVLSGLRHDPDQVTDLFRRFSMTLEDSATYQWILNKGLAQGVAQGVAQGIAQGVAQGIAQGVIEGARRTLLVVSRKRFGAIPPAAESAIAAITDPARLDRMAERASEATGLDDLLATP